MNNKLRWVTRDGKPVLQYREYCIVHEGKNEVVKLTDWEDVPEEACDEA